MIQNKIMPRRNAMSVLEFVRRNFFFQLILNRKWFLFQTV